MFWQVTGLLFQLFCVIKDELYLGLSCSWVALGPHQGKCENTRPLLITQDLTVLWDCAKAEPGRASTSVLLEISFIFSYRKARE